MRGSRIQMQGFALDRDLESKSMVIEDQSVRTNVQVGQKMW